MDDSFTKYIIKNNVCFEQGSGRVAYVPVDIVEDIIGTELAISRRAAQMIKNMVVIYHVFLIIFKKLNKIYQDETIIGYLLDIT